MLGGPDSARGPEVAQTLESKPFPQPYHVCIDCNNQMITLHVSKLSLQLTKISRVLV
jgi:hypothetical protein